MRNRVRHGKTDAVIVLKLEAAVGDNGTTILTVAADEFHAEIDDNTDPVVGDQQLLCWAQTRRSIGTAGHLWQR